MGRVQDLGLSFFITDIILVLLFLLLRSLKVEVRIETYGDLGCYVASGLHLLVVSWECRHANVHGNYYLERRAYDAYDLGILKEEKFALMVKTSL